MKKKIYALLIFLFGVGVVLFLPPKIKVAHVQCKSQFGPCSDEVKKLVEGRVGQSFFTVKGNLNKSLSESSRVEKYNIRFSLPSNLLVEVVEKKPEVALKFSDDRYFLFDKSGNVITETQSSALPTVTVKEVPTDDYVNYAVRLFIELFKYYDVNSATLNKFGLDVNVRGTQVTFPLEGDIDVLFGSMEVVLLQLNRFRQNPTINSAGNLRAVDLRYKNPVIR